MTGFRAMLDHLISNPKKLFLVDSLGALLSAFLLAGLLARFEDRFGMPRTALYFLSMVACVYAVYSICCYVFVVGNWRPFLILIAIANLGYCCLTVGLIFFFYQSLTAIGLTYFLLELMVVSCVISVELMAFSNTSGKDVESVGK